MMKQQIDNFSRFYSLLKRMPYEGDREDLKCELVSQATSGRTCSLKEVSRKEYHSMCETMERLCPDDGREKHEYRRRKARSSCLKLMQQIGVDTTDWNAVNSYCRSPKIAGKAFRDLGIPELESMSLRLRMILKKNSVQQPVK